MTEQIPRVIFIQTSRHKQPSKIAGVQYQFITVIEDHFFGITSVNIAGKTAQVTDREKTFVDCAARPDLSGGILQLAQALKNSHNRLNWDKLDAYLKQWGGGTVVKRLGYLIEALKLPNQRDRMDRWQSLITRGISLLEPGAGAYGSIRTRWQLRVNVPIVENDQQA